MEERMLILGLLFWFLAGTAYAATSVSQYGITWHFDRDYETGQFANGDYWVKGPVIITRITPDFDGRHNGWEVNPVFAGGQGFEEGAGEFDKSKVPSLPYTASPGQSIVKGISINQDPSSAPDCYHTRCLKTAAVLTVVGETPPGQGASVFRPPYPGSDKRYYYVSSLKTNKLPSLSLSNPPYSLSQALESHRRVQLDHKGGRMGRMIKPADNMPDYGGSIAVNTNNAIARLMLNDPIDAKMPALIMVVQAGIDRYHAVLNGQTWPGGGGHEPGRKLSLAFAAAMLDDEGMKEVVRTRKFFSENAGIQKGKDGKALFGFTDHNSEIRYWEYVVNPPSYNLERHDWYGYIDGGSNIDKDINGYQHCCLSQPWKGSALILELMPEMKQYWSDYELLLDYVHRYVSMGTKFQPDPCAMAPSHEWRKDYAQWTEYGKTWGPDGKGDCIKGQGRFPQNHGKYADQGGYSSAIVNALWSAYIKTDCTPSWQCTAWSVCINQVQTRICTDANNCASPVGKPSESQACGTCIPSWQCTDWTACANQVQSRICTDKNSCGTSSGKPAESQGCHGLNVGDRVRVVVSPSLRVRSSAGLGDATILGVQDYGSLGTIIGGPLSTDNFTWWNINYDSGPDGWSIENNNAERYLAYAGNCIHQSDTDCDGCIRQDELVNYIGKWKNENITLPNLMEVIRIWKQGC